MPKIDHSEHGKRRARGHETNCRLAVAAAMICGQTCDFRICQRSRCNVGPMLRSTQETEQERAPQEIGLSGETCAHLPRSVAQAGPAEYAAVFRLMKMVREIRQNGCSDAAMIANVRKGRQRPPGQK